MKIVFAGGGTAGHINPALAIADELAMSRDHEMAFIGRSGGAENRLVKASGIPLYTVRAEGLSRRMTLKNLRSAWLAISAVKESRRLLSDISPDVIVGTGGYVCWPVLKAGMTLGIPTAVHESNVYPGLATRMLSKKVDLVLLNSAETMKFLSRKDNTRIVGNPLRREFVTVDRNGARKRLGIGTGDFYIISFGGSIGAEKLNDAVIEMMLKASKGRTGVRHLHGVGTRYYEQTKERFPDLCRGINGHKVVSYINDMPLRLSAADLVICRAGAMTVSEIAVSGVPAILIPSPNVTDDHQRKNAKTICDGGGAIVIDEDELSGKRLTEAVEMLMTDRSALDGMKRAISRFAAPDAAKRTVEEIQRIASARS